MPPGANAKLRYQITSGNALGTFDVEPEVGTIFVAQPLDYEMEQRYELRLVASDGKWENQTLVVVQVANKNDEAPVFQQTEYHGAVSEEMSQLPVFVLEVSPVSGWVYVWGVARRMPCKPLSPCWFVSCHWVKAFGL